MRKALFAAIACVVLMSVAWAADAPPTPAPAPAPAEWQTKLDEKLGKEISIEFQDQTLSKAIDFLRRSGGVNIILDSHAADLSEKRLTVVLKNVRLESALAWTARLMGLDYVVRDEAIFLAKAGEMPQEWRAAMQERYSKMVESGQEAWLNEIEARLDKVVKVKFLGDDLPQVALFLATQSGINIVLDGHLAAAEKPVRIEAEMTVRNALNWVARQADVKWVLRDEVIYIADQEALTALRLETGMTPLDMVFRRPVTFHFNQTPLKDAMARITEFTKVAIDLQGVAADDLIPVTAEGDQVEISRAVRLVMNASKRPYAISFTGKTIHIVVSHPKVLKEEPKEAPPVKPEGTK